MDAYIQYVGIRTHNPKDVAQHYKEYFEMEELARSENGDVALTDGFYNLSILQAAKDERDLGLHQVGIHVDDLHDLVGRIEEFATSTTRLMSDVGGPFHGDFQVIDPNGLPVTISTSHFGVPSLDGLQRLPAIHHIATSVPNRTAMSLFYQQVFGFRKQMSRDENREQAREERVGPYTREGASLGDGHTAFQFLVYPVTTSDLDPGVKVGPRHTRFGINHLGFLVPELTLAVKSLPEDSVHRRPSARPMAEFRGMDPDGNEYDISQDKGYQVDAGVWVRA